MQHLKVAIGPHKAAPRIGRWIARQTKYLAVEVVSGDDASRILAATRDPYRERVDPTLYPLAIDDRGRAYFGAEAWLVVLWTLRDFRRWSYKLAAQPELRPQVGAFVAWVSRRRLCRLWLRLSPDCWRGNGG